MDNKGTKPKQRNRSRRKPRNGRSNEPMNKASIAPYHQHSAQDEETHPVCNRKNLTSSRNPRDDKENKNENSNDPIKRVEKYSITPYQQRSVHDEKSKRNNLSSSRNPRYDRYNKNVNSDNRVDKVSLVSYHKRSEHEEKTIKPSKRQSMPSSSRNQSKGTKENQENNNGYIFDKTKAKHDETWRYGNLSLSTEDGHGLILELIIAAGGQIKIRQLTDQLYQSVKCIKDINVISNLENIASHIFTKDKARDLIKHTPTLSICLKNSNTSGKCRESQCRDMHVCKYWWMGGDAGCSFGNNCQFGHNLNTKHNIAAMKYHWVHTLPVEQIISEMLKPQNRDAGCIPTICIYYNSNRGCSKGRNGSKCSCLHICEHFVHDNCKFGGRCNRSHNFRDEQPDRILRKFALENLVRQSEDYFIQLLLKNCRDYVTNDDPRTDSCESEQSYDDSYSSVATDDDVDNDDDDNDDDDGDEISATDSNKWSIRTKAGPLDVGITTGEKLNRSYQEFLRCKTLTIGIQGQRATVDFCKMECVVQEEGTELVYSLENTSFQDRTNGSTI